MELQDLVFEKISGNGLNIDDGGTTGGAHHVVLRGLRVQDIGSRGNEDAIKLSGIDDFEVVNCTVERWGSGGSAIETDGNACRNRCRRRSASA